MFLLKFDFRAGDYRLYLSRRTSWNDCLARADRGRETVGWETGVRFLLSCPHDRIESHMPRDSSCRSSRAVTSDARIMTTMANSSVAPAADVSIANGSEFADGDDPPLSRLSRTSRHPAWANVSEHDWADWRWQAQNAVRNPKQLVELLPFTAEER